MKRRSKAEWRMLITEYQASGESQREWCEIKGVNLHTFREHLRKERKIGMSGETSFGTSKNQESKSKSAVGDSVKRPVEWLSISKSKREPEDELIRIRVSCFEIAVPKGFNEEAFTKVCRSLMKL